MPRITPATVEASAAMSFENVFPQNHAHGEPRSKMLPRSNRPQLISAVANNPLSLPPMPSVTTLVDDDSAQNCGGWSRYCHVVMFDEVAPAQLMSISENPKYLAARWG